MRARRVNEALEDFLESPELPFNEELLGYLKSEFVFRDWPGSGEFVKVGQWEEIWVIPVEQSKPAKVEFELKLGEDGEGLAGSVPDDNFVERFKQIQELCRSEIEEAMSSLYVHEISIPALNNLITGIQEQKPKLEKINWDFDF